MSVWAVTRVTEWAVWEVPGETEKGLICVCAPASQAPSGPAHLRVRRGCGQLQSAAPSPPGEGR